MKKYIRIVTIVFVICILSCVLAFPSFASGENYFRGQLNANQKAVYDALIKAMPEKGAASCTVTATLPEPKIIVTNAFDDAFYDEFQKFLSDVCINAIYAVRLDSQYFFWEQMSHYTTPSLGKFYGPPFTVTISQVEVTVDVASPFKDAASMTTELKSAVAAIKPSGTTLYEKVKSIHDQICEKVTYDNAALTTNDLVALTAYGALINNKSVCEGYAKAFKLVCDKNGIDCIVVRGIATNSKGVTESHMWNYVKMDDGKWYGIDCTWDDAGDILRYKYFLFTSDVFSERTEDKELLVYPTLSKTAYSTAQEHVHSFGKWTESGDEHKRTCSCGEIQTENHAWDDGKVTAAATCAQNGEKTYTCKVCEATKKESIAKTDNHSYGNWTEKDSKSHERVCSVCGKTSKKDHDWDKGSLTTAPTCTSEGIKTFNCNDCKAVKTESVAKLSHSFGDWEKINDSQHQRTCSCGKTESENHKWDNGTVTQNATETEFGEKVYRCSACGAEKKETIAKIPTEQKDPADNPTEPEIPNNPTEPEIPDKPIEPNNPTEPENGIPTEYFIYGGIALALVALIIIFVCISAKKKNKN